jgi:hypothetical protein
VAPDVHRAQQMLISALTVPRPDRDRPAPAVVPHVVLAVRSATRMELETVIPVSVRLASGLLPAAILHNVGNAHRIVPVAQIRELVTATHVRLEQDHQTACQAAV